MKKLIGTAFVALAMVGTAGAALAGGDYRGETEKTQLSKELSFWKQFSERN